MESEKPMLVSKDFNRFIVYVFAWALTVFAMLNLVFNGHVPPIGMVFPGTILALLPIAIFIGVIISRSKRETFYSVYHVGAVIVASSILLNLTGWFIQWVPHFFKINFFSLKLLILIVVSPAVSIFFGGVMTGYYFKVNVRFMLISLLAGSIALYVFVFVLIRLIGFWGLELEAALPWILGCLFGRWIKNRSTIEEIDGAIRVIPLSAVLVRKYAGFLGHDPDAGRKFLMERRKDAARSDEKMKRLIK